MFNESIKRCVKKYIYICTNNIILKKCAYLSGLHSGGGVTVVFIISVVSVASVVDGATVVVTVFTVVVTVVSVDVVGAGVVGSIMYGFVGPSGCFGDMHSEKSQCSTLSRH